MSISDKTRSTAAHVGAGLCHAQETRAKEKTKPRSPAPRSPAPSENAVNTQAAAGWDGQTEARGPA